MCVIAELCAAEVRSSHQFEEEIGAASSENGLFITKMEFSVRTAVGAADAGVGLRHVAGGFERRDAGLSRFRRGLRGSQLGFSRFQLSLRISLLLVEPPRPFGLAARQV